MAVEGDESSTKIIDHQWHWVPQELLSDLSKRKALPRAERSDGGWVLELAEGFRLPLPPDLLLNLDDQLRTADQFGIDVVVSSPVVVAEVLHLDPVEAAELLVQVNETTAKAQRAHPRRFIGAAFLPLQNSDAAIGVLDKAVAEGLRCVSILASIDGRPVATDETLPVFKRIEEHGLPILLHPAIRSNTLAQRLGMHAEIGIGWMYHTALAALNLIQSGTFDACPDLVVLHPHLGGVFPYVLGRVDRLPGEDRSLSEYVQRHFYVDAVSATPGALELATDTYGIERILFATDFPFVPIPAAFSYLETSADSTQRSAILANRLPGLQMPDS